MSTLYIVKVMDAEKVYGYEFVNLSHAMGFISMEKQPCTLWIANTVTSTENRIPISE